MGLVRCWWIFLVVGVGVAGAQDTRVVFEPKVPPVCKVLTAELTPVNGGLPDSVERHYRDTERVEKAMRHCGDGKAVVLRVGENGKSVFLVGPTRLSGGVTLVVEAGVAVWGSRDPRNYDVAAGSCGIVGERGAGCKPLFAAENAPHAGIMGDGVIDGRGGARLLLPGGREGETWWELAHRAKVEDSQQAVSRLVVVRHSDDFTLYRITLRNSPNCHVSSEDTNGLTVWGVNIDTPKWARNTDGIDPGSGTTNVSIVDTFIRAGDDNISPKANGGAMTHLTVRGVHFYNGHGFGIGSQTQGGVGAVRVDGLSIDGADNGLRIKSDRSRGGLVEDVQFSDVCMRGVGNPIVLNPFYTTVEGTKIPVYRGIVLKNVRAMGVAAPAVVVAGLDAGHRLEATFDNVTVDGVKTGVITARHALVTERHGNLELSGEDVKVTGGDGGGVAYGCAGAFVEFPVTGGPVSAEIVPAADATFYVAADGTGDYYSVQAALNKVPATGGVVMVAPGVYRERLLVRQNHVTLRSANRDASRTVVVFDLSKGTQGSALGFSTVRVTGNDFLAENITFENDFNRTHKQENQGSQARALALVGDRNVLRNVRVLANQDTLYLGARQCGEATGSSCEVGRSYFEKSLIAGNVDFIYGDGLAVFQDCEIHSTEHAAGGFITAQGKHYAGQESGFVFRNARLTADAGVGNVYLGRPWRDLADVVFLDTTIGGHIVAAGWREWHPGETHRLDTAYYRTWDTVGITGKQLTAGEAGHYSVREVLGGKDKWDAAGVR